MKSTRRIVADVPEEIGVEFKIAAIKAGKKLNEAVTEALTMWVKKQQEQEIISATDLQEAK